jgi:hypothetical protein
VVGSFLAWAHVTIFFLGIIQRGVDPKGIDFPEGTMVVVLGSIAFVAGIILVVRRSDAVQHAFWVAVLLCSLSITAFALHDRIDATSQAGRAVSDTVDRLAAHFPGGANERKLEALVPKFSEVTPRYGLYVALGGGVVAATGGIAGLTLSSRKVTV